MMHLFATPALAHALGGSSLLDITGTKLNLEAIHELSDWFLTNHLKHKTVLKEYTNDEDANESIALKSALLVAQEQLNGRPSNN
jgi:hypothetical protein